MKIQIYWVSIILFSGVFLACGIPKNTDGTTIKAPPKLSLTSLQVASNDSWVHLFQNATVPEGEKLMLSFYARIQIDEPGGNYPSMKVIVNNRALQGEHMIHQGPFDSDSDLPCYHFPQFEDDAMASTCHEIPFAVLPRDGGPYSIQSPICDETFTSDAAYRDLFLLVYSPDFEHHNQPEKPTGEVNKWYVEDINPYHFEFEIPREWIVQDGFLLVSIDNPVKELQPYWECQDPDNSVADMTIAIENLEITTISDEANP